MRSFLRNEPPGEGSRRELRVYLLVLLISLTLSVLGALVHGVPTPVIHDEFSYIFAGETYARLRLTNPSPPSPESFFSPHILVEPTFSSKYPPAQGLFLAVGTLLGLPIAGIWLSGAFAAVALLWCSRAILPLRLALVPTGAFMITVLFASRWIAGYMGGLVPFMGGALVLGYFLRLQAEKPKVGAFLALGAGLGILALSRPFEGVILFVVLSVAYCDRLARLVRSVSVAGLMRRVSAVAALVGCALLFQVGLNRAVTGSALRMPHTEFHRQYMEVPLFRWQATTSPKKGDPRLRRVEKSFKVSDSWPGHLVFTLAMAVRAVFQVSGWLLPGFIALGAMLALRFMPRLLVATLIFPILQSGANYVHLAHYFAPIAPVWFLLVGIAAGFAANRYRKSCTSVMITALALAFASALPSWLSGESHPRPRRYHQIIDSLPANIPTLVFVRYSPDLSPNVNVVYNDPDLRSIVILANFLDDERNCHVARNFPNRQVLIATLGRVETQIVSMDLDRTCR